MIAPKETIHFIKDFDSTQNRLQSEDPSWIKNLRKASLNRFLECGIPTSKDEEWKYTNVSALNDLTLAIAHSGSILENNQLQKFLGPEINLVFVNGKFVKELSYAGIPAKGLTIRSWQQAIENDEKIIEQLLKKYDLQAQKPFVALNQSLAQEGIFVDVAANTAIPSLIHVVHITSSHAGALFTTPRCFIHLGKSSEASIVETHICFNKDLSYFSNPLTDVYLDENAILHYSKAQSESLKAYHIGTTRVWQERNSSYYGFSLSVGAALTRHDLDIILNGEGCHSTLNGLYAVDKAQHVDNHTSVDHRFPNCTSNQLYKGILNGDARAVFNGKIFVRPIAQLTNSYQLNKNLVLGHNCRIDTKPQLEIFADGVKCTHGATIGQLNEDELFYLQTRAIPKKRAVIMLSHGFVDDIINKVQNPAVQNIFNSLLVPVFQALE